MNPDDPEETAELDTLKCKFKCRSGQKEFEVPRDEWKINHQHLSCPHCGRTGHYGQSDTIETHY